MKQALLFSALIITVFGDRLDNRYLPPGPKNDNNVYQPPPVDSGFKNQNSGPVDQPFSAASQPQQQYSPSNFQQPQFPSQNFQQPNNQYLTPKKQENEQSGQPSNQFGQFSQPQQFNNGFSNPSRQYLTPNKQSEQSGQSSSQFGQFSQPKQFNNNGFSNNNQYSSSNKAPEQSSQPSNQFGQFSQPKQSHNGFSQDKQFSNNGFSSPSKAPEQSGQSSNQFGQFSQSKQSNNGFSSPSNQYLTPNSKDTSGASSNSFGQFKNPNQGQFSGSPNGFSNQFSQSSSQNSQYSGFQGNQGAQIGLIRSEFNPDGGDGHYNYLYETENGITAQEEGFEQNSGKFAKGGFSYTSPEGEQISIEYTADENGFVPTGSHVPQIPDAILKSIELNKAAEARGEYNEGSYKEDDHSAGQNGNGFQKSGPREQSPFASEQNKQVTPFGQQNNGYQYSGPAKSGFSQGNQQPAPFGSSHGPKPSFGQQKNNYQYPSPSDQGSFASQDSKQVAPSPFGAEKSFEQPKNHFGASSNGFNQKPSFPEQSPSFNQPRGQFAGSGSSQQGQGYHYQSPNGSGSSGFAGKFQREQESAPSGVQNQYSAPKFGTVQDNQGYKY